MFNKHSNCLYNTSGNRASQEAWPSGCVFESARHQSFAWAPWQVITLV